jgi:hypothetical protein
MADPVLRERLSCHAEEARSRRADVQGHESTRATIRTAGRMAAPQRRRRKQEVIAR